MKIGIDVGGTNLRAAIVEGEATLVAQHKEPVGEPRDPDTLADRIARIVADLAQSGNAADGDVRVGIGIAAMLRDRDGTVANSPHLRWRDVPFGRLLAARLGERFHVGVYNDVNAIVYGEAIAGAARGCRDVLGVYVGTGIGAGLVVNGELVDGASSCAGELGHTKVRWDADAAPCACGSRGCLEAYCGGSYLDRRVQSVRGRSDITLSDVDTAAAAGEDWALGLWTETATLLAVALGNAVALVNPERLVLGGGVLSRCGTLLSLVETMLEVAGNSASLERLSVVPAALGDDAGLVGAAHLAAR
jgi:glucokinase